MNASQVHCLNCGTLVPASDINIKTMTGKCAACDHIFNINSPSTNNDNSPPPRPKNISIESGSRDDFPGTQQDSNPFFKHGESLYLKFRWFTPMLFGLVFFCIAWDAFLVFWYSTALTQADTPWIMIVFPIGHLAVGVGLTYSTIAGLLNTTHVYADQHVVSVKHGPVPWRGNKEIPAKDIRKLTIEHSLTAHRNNSSQSSFKIMADVNGAETQLLARLEHSQARYIAYQLAKQIKVDLTSAAPSVF